MGPQVQPKCFWHPQHMRNNWELRKRGYLIRFGHMEALLLKKKDIKRPFFPPCRNWPICNVWYTMYDNWIYIGGCGSTHSHGHLHLFSTICNISCNHPIANHHRWQWPQFFLTSSSYFLQSNSTPSDRFSTLKVSWHANPPILSHIVQISKEFLLVSCTLKSDLSKARAPCSHLFSSSQLLPWVSRQEVSKRNQPTCLSNTQLRRQTLIFRKYQLKAGQDLPSFWAEALSLSIHSVVNDYTLAVTLQYDKNRTD